MIQKPFDFSYTRVGELLRQRLSEPAPARVQLLHGPRQVGKTTLLLELVREWGDRAIYVAADAPQASLSGWWDAQWKRAERSAQERATLLLIDEVHYVPEWSRLLKASSDRLAREKIPLHVVVSGSSSLGLGRGARESMAGRFERIGLHHWPPAELAQRFNIGEREAVIQAVTFGSYPGSVAFLADLPRWRQYLQDSIIEPAIGRDILMMETIRRPALLRQVFSICCGHPAEIISLQKMLGQLCDSGALETIAHYLHILEEACLVAAVPKYSDRVIRQRSAPRKIVVLNNALISALFCGPLPSAENNPALWGRWVENACIALAWNAGQRVCYWRSEPHEVDLVSEGSWGKWAVEVKTGAYTMKELGGLLEFTRLHGEFRPLVVCAPGTEGIADSGGIEAVSYPDFLWKGPPT